MRIARNAVTVAGNKFAIFSDFALRGMIAKNETTGEEKVIKTGGYISNDLAIRKAVANAFQLPTFRMK